MPSAQQFVRFRYRVSPYHATTVRGAWSAIVNYTGGDLVTFSGVTYRAMQPSLNAQPDISVDDWTDDIGTDDSFVMSPLFLAADNHFLDGLEPAVTYDIAVRYETADGRLSPWTDLTPHTVAGQVTAPKDVTGLAAVVTAVINGVNSIVTLSWNDSVSLNGRLYEIRDITGGAPGTFLNRVRATSFLVQLVTGSGNHTLRVQTIDTSENYSAGVSVVVAV